MENSLYCKKLVVQNGMVSCTSIPVHRVLWGIWWECCPHCKAYIIITEGFRVSSYWYGAQFKTGICVGKQTPQSFNLTFICGITILILPEWLHSSHQNTWRSWEHMTIHSLEVLPCYRPFVPWFCKNYEYGFEFVGHNSLFPHRIRIVALKRRLIHTNSWFNETLMYICGIINLYCIWKRVQLLKQRWSAPLG